MNFAPYIAISTRSKARLPGGPFLRSEQTDNTNGMERTMSHIAYDTHADRSGFSLKGTFAVFSTLAGWLKRQMELHRVQRHLESMDDRLLNDIGLERADIHSAVWRGRRLGKRTL